MKLSFEYPDMKTVKTNRAECFDKFDDVKMGNRLYWNFYTAAQRRNPEKRYIQIISRITQ